MRARSTTPAALVTALALLVALSVRAEGQTLPIDALPDDVRYDASIPTPASVLGWEPGTWHVRPDQLVRYFEVLAETSDRVQITRYGSTHEERPLLLATISSPANLAAIDDIRERHVDAVRRGATPTPDRKLIVWLGYSVHGNEPSGANASPLTAYYLAAARGEAIDALLDDTVVLLDPCINPDGLARFAHWANMYKGKQLVADRWHAEHREAWPGGRTNHYWFDLNRDWLLLTHPESRGRVAQFHAWKPNLLTDHHEMGTRSTFFFQPGVPSRQNPRTPARNLELTRAIAAYHADALDEAGELYYSEEGFDDFYYGKGSTYPDVQGAVGILFEQASSRGHVQENAWGELAFPRTIRNQLLTSLSSLEAADALREELLDHQAESVRSAREEAADDEVAGYVFGHPRDAARVQQMADILRRHDIAVHELAAAITVDEVRFEPDHAYLVPCDQNQYRLVKSLFETRTEFADDTFYDVSTWVLPLSFGLPYGEVARTDWDAALAGPAIDAPRPLAGRIGTSAPDDDTAAYVFEWHGLHAPRALARLQAAGVVAQVATRPFSADTQDGRHDFDYGTILVPVGVQELAHDELFPLLVAAARDDGLAVHALGSGLTPTGIDLGSPSARPLTAPRPALLVGSGVSSYQAGEAWHQLDLRWGQPVSLIEVDDLARVPLDDYTHVLMVGGGYGDLGESEVGTLQRWISGGGVLVASNGGATWATTHLLGGDAEERPGRPEHGEDDDDDEPVAEEDAEDEGDGEEARATYADYEADRAKTFVSGTIFETRLDRTHPLGYGYVQETLPVFRNSTATLAPGRDPYADAFVYTDAPLLSGYANDDNVQDIAGSVAATARRSGRGVVIRIADDPLFRGVWYGPSKLYANALYFGGIIKPTGPLGADSDADSDADQELDEDH